MKELSKIYDPKQVEDRIYQFWLDGGYFHAEPNPDKKPYTIVIPPPNITGQLHMGHALDETLQDILIRCRRMQGYEALWLPGTDHASIATEAKIVDAMKEEGLTKEDLGREGFLERAWEWKRQVRRPHHASSSKSWAPPATGTASASPWTRAAPRRCGRSLSASTNKGLIYRGERIINWCPHCMTSISDAEVEYEEQAGHFWHLRYPLSDGSGEVIWPPPARRRCSAIPLWRSTPRTSVTRISSVRRSSCRWLAARFRLSATTMSTWSSAPASSRSPRRTTRTTLRSGRRHNLPIIKVMNDDATMNEACRQICRAWTAMRPERPSSRTWRSRGISSRSRSTPTMSAPATAAAPPSSRWSPSSGSSR